ncbi:hypothetical protein [Thiosocius teredinicola]|uniref:hypothetical protein n=1 Tax=Thiosocius teredinicola TaxID=1973002 RepID=UPI000990F011
MKVAIDLPVITVLSLVLATGCVSQKEAMVKKGYPLVYAEGFDDGCHSGNKAGGSLFDEFRKDVGRFSRESNYAQGWSDGFRQCESQQEAAQRQMRIAVEKQKLAEQRKAGERAAQYHLERQVLKDVDTSNLKYLK